MTKKSWDDLTADEKADLVHKENRQLHDLINRQAKELDDLSKEVEKLKKKLKDKKLLLT